MCLDDLARDSQAEPQPHGACREEWCGNFLRGFWREARPVVVYLHFREPTTFAVKTLIELHLHGDLGVLGVRLKCIEKNFEESVLQRGAIAGNQRRPNVRIELKQR